MKTTLKITVIAFVALALSSLATSDVLAKKGGGHWHGHHHHHWHGHHWGHHGGHHWRYHVGYHWGHHDDHHRGHWHGHYRYRTSFGKVKF